MQWTYKVVRGVIFTSIIAIVALFVLLYTALSIPPVHDFLRKQVQSELSGFLNTKVEIGHLTIRPANELIIEDVRIFDHNRKECLEIGELGAGIDIWGLIFKGNIEITFVELLDFKADIYQEAKDEPLNIDFIIKAFEPKDKTKPPTKFDLKIRNIVVRNGDISFARMWKPQPIKGIFSPDYIEISDFNGDVTIPRLSNSYSEIDVRKLSFNEKSGLQVKEISGLCKIKSNAIVISDFTVRLPESEIRSESLVLPKDILTEGKDKDKLKISFNPEVFNITPSNLSCFYPDLAKFDTQIPIELNIKGNRNFIDISKFNIDAPQYGFSSSLSALTNNYLDKDKINIEVKDFHINSNAEFANLLISLIPSLQNNTYEPLMGKLGNIYIDLTGKYLSSRHYIFANSAINTSIGEVDIKGFGSLAEDIVDGNVHLNIPAFNFANISDNLPVKETKNISLDVMGRINAKDFKASSGIAEITIGELNILNRSVSSLQGKIAKNDNNYSLDIAIDDVNLNGVLAANLQENGVDTSWDLEASIADFDTYSSFLTDQPESDFELKGDLSIHGTGNSIDNASGILQLTDFSFTKWNGKNISLNNLTLQLSQNEGTAKELSLTSEIADFRITGDYKISRIPDMVKETLWEICPSVFPAFMTEEKCGSGNFELSITDCRPIIDFFNLPVFPLTELTVTGSFNSEYNHIDISTLIPYIQQGTNKLITDTYLSLDVNGMERSTIFSAGAVYPTKKGLLKLDLDLNGKNGMYDVTLDFNRGRDVSFYGDISFILALDKHPVSDQIDITANFLPSLIHLNDTPWNVEESEIRFDGNELDVDSFCIRHADQFIFIDGKNTKSGEGVITLTLADINLDYLFETLNIPHVDFGGNATGAVVAREIFSKQPDVKTDHLSVSGLSYNDALLGDAELSSYLDLPEKKIAIGAVISGNDKVVATADGGVWFGKDSLAFDFKADGVNVGFMQPFMAAFSSDVRGKASGNALLFGKFSDIDMTGTLVTDKAEILIDYINAYYTGSDTVYLTPGRIDIPAFKVKDKFGHTATLQGVLTHDCFHNPEFKFTIKDMDNLLVYNTNSKINPLWYGTLFASGVGEIVGKPGLVSIAADVETSPGSDFTFVLSDQQEAVKSHFLTFTDKRRAEEENHMVVKEEEVPDFLRHFMQTKTSNTTSAPDIYKMDFRVSVTDDVKFNLIMDPIAGDKITAYGTGAMNMTYTSLTDELRLYGKYTLDKGTYNFSLQDIILKDFTIKPGSTIAFTGDPYTGILNITAAYRVNTSLTELDRSFANDRELNRTSVPVEALLKVSGVLTSPNIDFDIELPTVTEETAQKVRSIISTEDMMSKQVIYLVALNKFYPPEYMTTNNSGGEWASVASSTISSQLQNMIGQITDKFTVAPSIRSDKGDFSDIEVDIALSSQLFDNRLLLNGNIGYRDPSNSSTTFVGDFDLEYLLNKKGTWRLKAYNHFNDQNYYLKSALTTQGIGIVWRKEFGSPRKKNRGEAVKKKDEEEIPEQNK